MPEVGQPAPDFTLFDTQGNEVSLASFRGKENVALFFFPKAFTGTCERQISSHEENSAAFTDLNTQIIGVSTDQSPAQAAFLKQCGGKSFPILSDFRHKVINSYGIARSEGQLPNERATFLIDKEGVLRWKYIEPQPGQWHGIDTELNALREFAS